MVRKDMKKIIDPDVSRDEKKNIISSTDREWNFLIITWNCFTCSYICICEINFIYSNVYDLNQGPFQDHQMFKRERDKHAENEIFFLGKMTKYVPFFFSVCPLTFEIKSY